jgi:hypothetical protein
MPGGVVDIAIAEDWSVSMAGPVTKVCAGVISGEMFKPPQRVDG